MASCLCASYIERLISCHCHSFSAVLIWDSAVLRHWAGCHSAQALPAINSILSGFIVTGGEIN